MLDNRSTRLKENLILASLGEEILARHLEFQIFEASAREVPSMPFKKGELPEDHFGFPDTMKETQHGRDE
jgi:hypothetical protein